MRKLGFSGAWSVRIGLALVALVLALSAEWLRPESVIRIDEGLRDYFVRWSADTSIEDRVVVIDIGEAALQEAGPWPWPRARIADLVEILLGTYQVRAVGLDIVFSEPADEDGDARLAALATHAPLALAQIFDYVPRTPAMLLGHVGGDVAQSSGPSVQALGFIANHAGLAAARCVGNIGYLPDADGVLRRIPELTRFGGKDYSHLSSALLNCTTDTADAALQPLGLGDKDGFWRVPYSRALNAYTVISAADILNERAPPELLAGRFVLVGSSSLGLGDRVSTPLAPLSSGVMVHAASLTGLLDLAQGRASVPTSGRPLLLAWCLMSVAIASFFIARLAAWASLLLLLGLVVSWLGLAFVGVTQQVEWSVTAPLWSYLFLILFALPFEWWQAQRRTRRVMNTFSHYVAQPVLDEIVRLGMNYSLKPTLRDVTVLIADMEGYTHATSQLSLEDAASLTKDFLVCLTRPVLSWRGTLDKYTGDGLVAFWGAPLDCADQADRAVSAALAILAEVDAFNFERQRTGAVTVQVRIGIESGRAIVGDLGTEFRSTYTAVGDCINFASRLEAAARDLPTQLVIGAAANGLLKQHRTRSLGKIALRGTQTTIDVFTV